MKSPKQILASVLFTTLIAVAAPMAQADPMHEGPDSMEMGGHGGPGGMHGEDTPPFLHGLDLTEAQRDKIFELHYAQIPTLRAKFKALRTAHEELHKLSLSAQYDETKAHALIDASTRALADIESIKASTDNQIFQLLTADQRKKLSEHLSHREHGWHGGEAMKHDQ